jgi:hypothetical protein
MSETSQGSRSHGGRRFGLAALAVTLAAGVGAGVLYAWSQQYDGRVLPNVRLGSTELGGLTREQAEAKIANAYRALGTGQITLTGPDGEMTTISYADVGRGRDTSALLDAALAAGRDGEAGGRRRDPRHDDRPGPRGRLRIGRPRRYVHRLPGERGSRRG